MIDAMPDVESRRRYLFGKSGVEGIRGKAALERIIRDLKESIAPPP